MNIIRMRQPLPASETRCLAHHATEPQDWCPRRYECARHQTIGADRHADKHKVAFRVCADDAVDGFLTIAEPA